MHTQVHNAAEFSRHNRANGGQQRALHGSAGPSCSHPDKHSGPNCGVAAPASRRIRIILIDRDPRLPQRPTNLDSGHDPDLCHHFDKQISNFKIFLFIYSIMC